MTEQLCAATHRYEPERPRRAADGLHLCHGCRDRLERDIAEAPYWHDELAGALSRPGRSGQPLTGSRDPGLKLSDAAAEHRRHISALLRSWARLTADERGIVPPGRDDPHSVSAWLCAAHVDWLAAHPAADEIADDFRPIRGRAIGLIDPTRRVYRDVGHCVETPDTGRCDGTLTAVVHDEDDPSPSLITCDTCPATYDSSRWLRLGWRIIADRGISA